jgi:hypothetical protein
MRRAQGCRPIVGLALAVLLAISGARAPVVMADVPTDASRSDLKGRAPDYTNVLIDSQANTGRQTILYCNGNTTTQFVSRVGDHEKCRELIANSAERRASQRIIASPPFSVGGSW